MTTLEMPNDESMSSRGADLNHPITQVDSYFRPASRHAVLRRLDAVTSGDRKVLVVLTLIVAALVSITTVTLALVAMVFFESGPLGPSAQPEARALAIVMPVGGAGIAVAVLAGTLRSTDFSPLVGTPARVMAYLARLLPLAGLVLLAATMLLINDELQTSSATRWIFVRATLWTGMAVSCLYVLRPRKPRYIGVVDIDRTARVVLPLIVIMIAVAMTFATDFDRHELSTHRAISALLTPTASVIALAASPIVIGLFINIAVKGLLDTRDRGELIFQYLGRRHRHVAALVFMKLIALLGICAVVQLFDKNSSPLSWTASGWSFAVGAAMIAIFLFVVDDRVVLAPTDYSAVAQNAPLFLPGLLGLVYPGVILSVVVTFAVDRPFALTAALIIVVLALLPKYLAMARSRRTLYRGTVMTTVFAVIVLGAMPAINPVQGAGGHLISSTFLYVGITIGIIVGGLAAMIGVGWVLVIAVRSRRFGLLTFGLTVVVWCVLLGAWSSSGSIRWTQFDIALTALLAALAAATLFGFRHTVDRVEIVVAATATLLLVESASLCDLLRPPFRVLPLLFAVVGPGIVGIWRCVRALRRLPERRMAVVRLATIALIYQGLAIITWVAHSRLLPGFIDSLSNAIMGFVCIPLILLLIAAREPVARSARIAAPRPKLDVGRQF
jgi:hypothetical protein